MFAQASLPDPSSLAPLHPAVAIALLVAAVVIAALAVFKDAIRDRFRRAPAEQPPATGQLPPVPGTDAAIDRLEQRTDQLLDRYRTEIAAADGRIAQLERLVEQMRQTHHREIEQMRAEMQRLQMMLWQRGPH